MEYLKNERKRKFALCVSLLFFSLYFVHCKKKRRNKPTYRRNIIKLNNEISSMCSFISLFIYCMILKNREQTLHECNLVSSHSITWLLPFVIIVARTPFYSPWISSQSFIEWNLLSLSYLFLYGGGLISKIVCPFLRFSSFFIWMAWLRNAWIELCGQVVWKSWV